MKRADVAVIGAGVVGSAVALALARRGATVDLLEAHGEPGLEASGTNSGILHTGFDSEPGELETELILRAAELRPAVVEQLGLPHLPCGGLVRARSEDERSAVRDLADNASQNGVDASLRDDGSLEVPGEAITDPVVFVLALAAAAVRHGARLRTHFRVTGIEPADGYLALTSASAERVPCTMAVNCAGLHADDVARLAGDESFSIYPRKGEFLVLQPPEGERLEHILLPIPSKRTKGVLVFPAIGGQVIVGPSAIDQEDKYDWRVRDEAREELLGQAAGLWGPLEEAETVAAYAGLRPAGRDLNYLIAPSPATAALVNVAAIRSTGLTASLGIAERVCTLVEEAGVELGPEQDLLPGPPPRIEVPWWRRSAEVLAA